MDGAGDFGFRGRLKVSLEKTALLPQKTVTHDTLPTNELLVVSYHSHILHNMYDNRAARDGP